MFIQDQIIQDVDSNDVLLYMKGSPENSPCGYSTRLVTILNHIGLTYVTRDVLSSEELRRGAKAHAGVRTLPLLFVKGEYVGGSNDIRAMHEAGTLITFFEERGVPTAVDPLEEALVLEDVSREQIISCSKAS